MKNKLVIDPNIKSWIDYPSNTHFPIQNLPFGIFSNHDNTRRVCTIIGDTVIAVSYTHLDVYKRQPGTNGSTSPSIK